MLTFPKKDNLLFKQVKKQTKISMNAVNKFNI